MENLLYKIALTLLPGVGDVNAKKLVAHCGGVEAIFHEKRSNLLLIEGMGEKTVNAIKSADVMKEAEEEVRFVEENQIQVDFYLDKSYPRRLLHCNDGPILLYSKGEINWNAEKVISIVGTRMPTRNGQYICEKLVADLKAFNVTIVSGLAYGIDITAHKAALKHRIPTIGIMASGIQNVYPRTHVKTAEQMQENGGIATDYRSDSAVLPINFAERNRIVAGLADAVVVVESAKKGGSLITADLANGYNRDVFAVPGRIDDSQSMGCNKLIKSHKAALIESAQDIAYVLSWEKPSQQKAKANIQKQLFIELSDDERKLLSAFADEKQLAIDEISVKSGFPISKTSSLLLQIEFIGLVRSLPGKVYEIV